ncbi:MAG: fructosamine kinase family protein [Anaerococcus sp.]|nr:fructosamine kinase family protein [Anaerococcus sp.]
MDDILNSLPIDIGDIRFMGGENKENFKVYGKDGIYFLTIKDYEKEGYFDNLALSLDLLKLNHIKAPRLIDKGDIKGKSFILTTYLNEGRSRSQKDLAGLIGKIHKIKSPKSKFGFDYPSFIGSLDFPNSYKDSWQEFFIERLDRLVKSLREKEVFKNKDLLTYKRLRKIIIRLLDDHKSDPVLVHGNLSEGNLMFLEDGNPAVYNLLSFYGDREFDLASSTIYEGFNQEFYQSFGKSLDMDERFSLRLEFYRLYTYLLYLNQDGNMYRNIVDSSVSKILRNY